jgi:amino-acid N-acetyltransferase
MSASEPSAADRFVELFRSSAPYVHAHRGRTFVIAFGGEAQKSAGFRDLVHDVALLAALGIRVVLVHGARPQIDALAKQRGVKPAWAGGRRITDAATMRDVQAAVGSIRVEIEARLSMGVPSSPMGGARIRVASGNFVVARPIGVVDGVDHGYAGVVRRVDAEGIRQRLDSGAVVLISPLGYSVTGEAFNVSAHEVGCETAIALGADKLIALVEGRITDAKDRPLHELTPDEAEALSKKKRAADWRRHLDAAVRACRGGVRRAHLVDRRAHGGLLLELFTHEGIGTMITAETYRDVRAAELRDVGGILDLVEPLAKQGLLLRRPRELVENEIDRFSVIERDGLVTACAAFYPYKHAAELACVAVHPRYRDAGLGDKLIAFFERRAREQGITKLFVLTTGAAHWFRERGFEPGKQSDLPRAKREAIDARRGSKVMIKRVKQRRR